MKLLVPPLKIHENDGFRPDIDIFNRKAYGESLFNLINNTEDELVLALDAPWGEGKSTFIKMWRGLLAENKVANVYFDAFENDYQQDPLLAISSQLYALIDKKDDSTQAEFKKKALSALKVIGRASLRVGIKALTAGVLDETILEQTDNIEDASDEASDLIDNFIAKQLTKSEENSKSLLAFKEYLSTLGEKLGAGKNLVFIIDELDRCKPKFSLAILESIKHLFSVPHITFVLVMNRTQLEEAVKCEYGAGVDASRYLQKFVSVWTSLPKSNFDHQSLGNGYVRSCLKAMNFEIKTQAQHDAIGYIEELVNHYNLSLREVEKTLTNFAIIYNATDECNLNSEYLTLAIFLCVIKVIKPEIYNKLSRKKIDYPELVKSADLTRLKAQYWDEQEEHPLRWLLKYNLSTEDEANELVASMKTQRVNRMHNNRNIVTTTCKWLDTFTRQ